MLHLVVMLRRARESNARRAVPGPRISNPVPYLSASPPNVLLVEGSNLGLRVQSPASMPAGPTSIGTLPGIEPGTSPFVAALFVVLRYRGLEGLAGIEPAASVWKADVSAEFTTAPGWWRGRTATAEAFGLQPRGLTAYPASPCPHQGASGVSIHLPKARRPSRNQRARPSRSIATDFSIRAARVSAFFALVTWYTCQDCLL